MSSGTNRVQPDKARRRFRVADLLDEIFGFDVFLSYAHADASDYARLLRRELVDRGLRVCSDWRNFYVGRELPWLTRRRVRRSRCLVVIATPGALESDWVLIEAKEALQSGLPVVVVDCGRCYPSSSSPLRQLLGERLHVVEGRARPSRQTAAQIERAIAGRRQESLRWRVLLAVVALLSMSLAAAIIMAVSAARSAEAAERQASANDLRLAVLRFDEGRPAAAFAHLAQAVRRNGDRNATECAYFHLRYGNFAWPVASADVADHFGPAPHGEAADTAIRIPGDGRSPENGESPFRLELALPEDLPSMWFPAFPTPVGDLAFDAEDRYARVSVGYEDEAGFQNWGSSYFDTSFGAALGAMHAARQAPETTRPRTSIRLPSPSRMPGDTSTFAETSSSPFGCGLIAAAGSVQEKDSPDFLALELWRADLSERIAMARFDGSPYHSHIDHLEFCDRGRTLAMVVNDTGFEGEQERGRVLLWHVAELSVRNETRFAAYPTGTLLDAAANRLLVAFSDSVNIGTGSNFLVCFDVADGSETARYRMPAGFRESTRIYEIDERRMLCVHGRYRMGLGERDWWRVFDKRTLRPLSPDVGLHTPLGATDASGISSWTAQTTHPPCIQVHRNEHTISWRLPPADDAPAWLPDVLEAVGGWRFNDVGGFVQVPAPHERLAAIRQRVAQAPGAWPQLLRWCCSDRTKRGPDPESPPKQLTAAEKPGLPTGYAAPVPAAEQPSAGTPPTDDGRYAVQAGDTLRKIAADELGDPERWRELFQANRDLLTSPDQLQIGWLLRIPK